MKLRPYQQRTLDDLYAWWVSHPGADQAPLVSVPTGGGKSVIIAELVRLLFDTWPDAHPRTVVIVPSKELAEQNAEKLIALLPTHIRVGYYSASLGRKRPDADVIVATIGSIYRAAHVLGNIRCVVIDEAHLVNPDGKEAGRYRSFLSDLAKYCEFRVVGYTATPFRGNGIWLTDGESPLFTGVASTVTITELLADQYLSPLVRPIDVVTTQIDTEGISTTSGDYNIGQLSDRVEQYLESAASEACTLAAERRKWIAFCPTVDNANHLSSILNARGVASAVVIGETPKAERAQTIADFRAGRLRCLVTVLALATGFDVPDVDCILWLRPTISPVLYVQGAGRGLRIAPGKTDCLWIDFTTTTTRMGPIDTIKGRKRPRKRDDIDRGAPVRICDQCGNLAPASAKLCPSCGYEFPPPEHAAHAIANNSAVLSIQAKPEINTYEVTDVRYALHRKDGRPDSIRVEYYSGLRRVVSEWVCFDHGGFATGKAQNWWRARTTKEMPQSTAEALDGIHTDEPLAIPAAVVVNDSGKWPELIRPVWPENKKEAA